MKLGVREWILLGLLAAIPLGSWWFVFRPRNTEITKAKMDIKAKQAKLEQMNRAVEAKEALKSDIDAYNQAIEFFQSRLPQEKEMDQVLREVWHLAQVNNLSAKSVRTLKRSRGVTVVDPTGPYAEQPVVLELEGDFNAGLYSFLLDLEMRPRITRIHQMDIERLKNGSEGQIRVAMVMSVFFERNAGSE